MDHPRHHAVIAGLPNVLLQCARVPAPPRSHTSGVLTLLPSPRACNSALTGRGAIDLPGAPRSTHARARNPTFHRPRGSGNGFRNGLQQALHVLQLRPSFIQPVSSQRRHTGGLRGGAAVLMTATCLLVSSSSRFPIAVVSSMIDPFIFSSPVVLSVSGLAPICLRRGYPTAPSLPRVADFIEPPINDALQSSLRFSRRLFSG